MATVKDPSTQFAKNLVIYIQITKSKIPTSIDGRHLCVAPNKFLQFGNRCSFELDIESICNSIFQRGSGWLMESHCANAFYSIFQINCARRALVILLVQNIQELQRRAVDWQISKLGAGSSLLELVFECMILICNHDTFNQQQSMRYSFSPKTTPQMRNWRILQIRPF